LLAAPTHELSHVPGQQTPYRPPPRSGWELHLGWVEYGYRSGAGPYGDHAPFVQRGQVMVALDGRARELVLDDPARIGHRAHHIRDRGRG